MVCGEAAPSMCQASRTVDKHQQASTKVSAVDGKWRGGSVHVPSIKSSEQALASIRASHEWCAREGSYFVCVSSAEVTRMQSVGCASGPGVRCLLFRSGTVFDLPKSKSGTSQGMQLALHLCVCAVILQTHLDVILCLCTFGTHLQKNGSGSVGRVLGSHAAEDVHVDRRGGESAHARDAWVWPPCCPGSYSAHAHPRLHMEKPSLGPHPPLQTCLSSAGRVIKTSNAACCFTPDTQLACPHTH
eukprot:1024688-Pelagomonas_calceolata.AAC.1